MVLPALGIPLIGQTATDKLSKVVNSLYGVTHETCREAGLGEKATNNLTGFLQTFDYELPFSYLFAKKSELTKNEVVCITGKLVSYKNKAEATEVLEARGYTVKSSVTKDVTILVNEGGDESAKTVKARESGVTIVTNLKQYLGE
jgi:NAD-dependent DNA ligase